MYLVLLGFTGLFFARGGASRRREKTNRDQREAADPFAYFRWIFVSRIFVFFFAFFSFALLESSFVLVFFSLFFFLPPIGNADRTVITRLGHGVALLFRFFLGRGGGGG